MEQYNREICDLVSPQTT